MDQSTITVRYAKAFFETAKEKKLLEVFKADMQLVLDVSNNSTDFHLLLESPIVKESKKAELISLIFKGKINELTLNFLLLIVKNKRENHIPEISRNFLALTRKDQNIKSATLITATKMTDETISKIGEIMENQLKTKVELSSEVDPEIIGGMVIRIEDKQYDASVATQIKRIKQKLLESELK